MILSWIQTLFLGVAILGIPASITLWVLAFQRLRDGQPLLKWTPRSTVPWTLLDIILVMVIAVLSIALANTWVIQQFGVDLADSKLEDLLPHQQLTMLTAMACSSMFALLLSLAVVRLRTGATAKDYGLQTTSIFSDLRLSVVAFTMLIVPMLAIQVALTLVFEPAERHPFIDLILESPDIRLLGIITFLAIIVAPLTEEFLFRVLLIGWLDRLLGQRDVSQFPNPESSNPELTDTIPSTQTLLRHEQADGMISGSEPKTISNGPGAIDNGETPTFDAMDEPSHSAEREKTSPPTYSWSIPIVISGLLFGLAHFGQGVAPVSLIFLGCGLGYLYQRTHRVLPCILVHFLVNLLAIAQLALYIAQHSES